MKLLILVATVWATAAASWMPIQEKYHGPLHYPKIYKGVPVEPKEVQHARESHLNALAHAIHNGHHYDHHEDHHQNDHYHHQEKKWQGPLHYPKIYKGVPVETKEVQHAREAHLHALAHSYHGDEDHYVHYFHDGQYDEEHNYDGQYQDLHNFDGHHDEKKWHGPLHYPKIHKGVPVEPEEVQHAREAHLHALSHASQHGHQRKRRGASTSYVHFSSEVDHQAPIHHHQHDYDMIKSHGDALKTYHGGFSYEQTHAPIYGYQKRHDAEEHYGNEGYAYEQIHAPVYVEHRYYEHQVPLIGHDGLPLDTLEVQHAKEAHFAAHDKLHHH